MTGRQDGDAARDERILALAESEPIRALVDSAPPLSEEQLRTLALILAPAGDHDD